jgi:hypothetical protein
MTDTIVVGDDSPIESKKDQMANWAYFACPVNMISKPEFLATVKAVSKDLLAEQKKIYPKLHPVYPIRQTGSMLSDDRIKPFLDYIGSTAWNILDSQGYAMDNLTVYFQEMWCQEHHMHSGHEEHMHGGGAQLVGFYFLDVPKDSGKLILHDPRPGKRLVNLPEKNVSQISIGSTAVNFTPVAGDLYFVPSWLPHSISRNADSKPLRFIHFTIGVSMINPTVDVDTGMPPEIV